MNPIMTMVGKYRAYKLTKEDLTKIDQAKLMGGAGTIADALLHKVCVMQLVSMVTTEAEKVFTTRQDQYGNSYTDKPICVSEVITDTMIALNDDENITDEERQQLKTLLADIINTCPIKTTEYTKKSGTRVVYQSRAYKDEAYLEAEEKRREILKKFLDNGLSHKKGARVIHPAGPTFQEALGMVKKAAAVYHTDTAA